MNETTRRGLLLLLPTLALLAVTVLPLVLGAQTLFLRDTFSFHLPVKTVQAEAMRAGDMPLLDPSRGGGQPLAGNPNAVPFHPTNLLYLAAPTLWAFNAHFWLHLLVAPLAMFWLARRVGLEAWGAAAAGAFWGVSGFFLSQMNFYNLVGGTAALPAFLASALAAAGAGARSWHLVVAGALWAVLIVGGDPILAAQSGILLLVFLAARSTWRGDEELSPPGAGRVGVALAGGTLLAAPQWIEFFRILGLSYRGYQGYEAESALTASMNPLLMLEWVLPFAFGRPNLELWGTGAFGQEGAPFFFSLFPGVLALLCVLCSGLPRRRWQMALWGVGLLGLFVALGDHNPLMRLAAGLPGFSLARYPIKFLVLVAVPAALLAGRGAQRLFEDGGLRLGLRAAGGLSLVYLAIAGAALDREGALARFVTGLMGRDDPERLQRVLQNWLASSIFLVVVLGAGLLARYLGVRRATLGMTLFLLLHTGSQLFLLGPLMPTEPPSQYAGTPPPQPHLRAGETVVHGAFRVFGPSTTQREYAGREVAGITRGLWSEMQPLAGVPRGVRYELNVSPEGLDSFLVQMAADGMVTLDDVQRLRVLRALGVGAVLLDRELVLEEPAGDLVRLRAVVDSAGVPLRVYEIVDPAPAVALLGETWPTPHLNAAVAAMFDAAFDPHRAVAIPGEGERETNPPGTVEIVQDDYPRLELRTRSEGGGVLLVQRSFHTLYRVTVDGEEATPFAANLSRLGVRVPAGEHTVIVDVDRGPSRASVALSAVGLVGLLVAARRFGAAAPLP